MGKAWSSMFHPFGDTRYKYTEGKLVIHHWISSGYSGYGSKMIFFMIYYYDIFQKNARWSTVPPCLRHRHTRKHGVQSGTVEENLPSWDNFDPKMIPWWSIMIYLHFYYYISIIISYGDLSSIMIYFYIPPQKIEMVEMVEMVEGTIYKRCLQGGGLAAECANGALGRLRGFYLAPWEWALNDPSCGWNCWVHPGSRYVFYYFTEGTWYDDCIWLQKRTKCEHCQFNGELTIFDEGKYCNWRSKRQPLCFDLLTWNMMTFDHWNCGDSWQWGAGFAFLCFPLKALAVWLSWPS